MPATRTVSSRLVLILNQYLSLAPMPWPNCMTGHVRACIPVHGQTGNKFIYTWSQVAFLLDKAPLRACTSTWHKRQNVSIENTSIHVHFLHTCTFSAVIRGKMVRKQLKTPNLWKSLWVQIRERKMTGRARADDLPTGLGPAENSNRELWSKIL
jgi:hypothetical protein